jgi:ribosomal protein L37E
VIGVKTSRNRETVAFRPEELEAVVVVDERVFKASPVGWYDELVDLALERVAPVERCREKSQYRVRRYVRMYQSGSPFPPIVVAGPIPGAQRHKIIGGHHRYLAARKVGAASMLAWTCFYVPFQGAYGTIHYRLARMSDTEIGHKIAAKLGREWCPRCGGFLNSDRRTGECRSCGYPDEQTAATHSVQSAG